MRNDVIQLIDKEKIIAIVRGIEKEKILPMAEALYNGGIRVIEVTYSANEPEKDVYTAEKINMLAKRFGKDMCIGAGTVLKISQVEWTKAAGGQFIISPDCYDKVIKTTRELDMVSIPGAISATEAQAAYRMGADYVKLFPISSLGPAYVKAITAPLSHIKFLAVGGVNENNMNDYLKAGVCGFGIGSNLVNSQTVENAADLTELAKKYTEVIK